MKKMFLMALMAAAATTAFAQDALVKQAAKLTSKGEYKQAEDLLKPALTSSETLDKAAAWFQLSDINYQHFNKIKTKVMEDQVMKKQEAYDTVGMHHSLIAAYEAALECDKYDMQPNAKGKVKPRFRAKNQERFKNLGGDMVNAGLYEYNHKNPQAAQKDWMHYLDMASTSLFSEVNDMPKDAFRPDILYYAALVSYTQKDYVNAEKYAKEAAAIPEKANDANEILLFSQKENCKTAADSVNYMNTVKSLRKQYPKEDRYFNLLMDYFNKPGKEADKKAWVEEEMALDPQNKMVWAVKGETEMNAEQWDAAVESFKKAIEIDPQFVPCYFNIGVCLNSKARVLQDQLADKNGTISKVNFEKVKAVLSESLGYLEKCQQLDPSRNTANWAYPLYQIYYSLGNKDKAAEMEKLLGR